MPSRRIFLLSSVGAVALAAFRSPPAWSAEEPFEVTHTDAEWKAMLTDEQYQILRHEDTERPFTSTLNTEKRKGTFHCAGCELPLYSSETKYDSGTGWPSFWEAMPNAVGLREDTTFGMVRTECHCRRCGGHLGHVFDDGPPPTGKRHCINGLSMTFAAGTSS
ncbi:peptide-methionine (R)-S-oxide reductase [Pararhizobium capsulatum DSM 1112]|uniref:peptide-methionine (R)-S-oxide reductase n=1 Tax=Pararhizobium capsulatum DSM 1112 TaxID=1121113 RepID=A0ABU0BMV9_9HYPH|nr:peptide-methionine (R)-S-oxide reductase MsrB [Pararhizobium capsulatum]MDQ0318785.1 peptide-methionine (R)-S-oxide reductase [Pararhizobium capsulatum DSM 1112]